MALFDAVEESIRGTSDNRGETRLIECRDCGVKLDKAIPLCPGCNSPNIAVYDF